MVNKIGDNQYINTYTRNAKTLGTEDDKAPAFLLGYDEEGVVWDRSDNRKGKKEENLADKAKSGRNDVGAKSGRNLRDRDTYESTIIPQTSTETKAEENKEQPALSLSEIVNQVFTSIKESIMKVFNFIWYGDEKNQNKTEEKSGEIAEEVLEEKLDASKEVTMNNEDAGNEVKSVSVEKKYATEFDRRLAQAGQGVKGKPARNTDLLTTYDGRGVIRSVSPTDSKLILEGDKSIKL